MRMGSGVVCVLYIGKMGIRGVKDFTRMGKTKGITNGTIKMAMYLFTQISYKTNWTGSKSGIMRMEICNGWQTIRMESLKESL